MRTQENQDQICTMLQRIGRLLPVVFSLALLWLNYQDELGTLLASILFLAVVAYVAVTGNTLRGRVQRLFQSFRLVRQRHSSKHWNWSLQLILKRKAVTFRNIRRCGKHRTEERRNSMFADLSTRNDADKTVEIEIPVPLLKECENQARALNLSMNEVFTEAIYKFLEILPPNPRLALFQLHR